MAKNKAAKAGAGALAAGKKARSNDYVQRLIEDASLRDDLQDAFEATRKAYARLAKSKDPAKAVFDDKKTQRELKDAASSLRDAADSLRGGKKKKKRGFGAVVGVVLIGGVAALVLSDGLRQKLLDALFGAEEEFEYTSSTVPPAPTEPAGATTEAAAT